MDETHLEKLWILYKGDPECGTCYCCYTHKMIYDRVVAMCPCIVYSKYRDLNCGFRGGKSHAYYHLEKPTRMPTADEFIETFGLL